MQKKLLGLAIGFLLGALVGYAVVMIFAPVTGKDLRDNLQGHMKQVKDSANDAAEKRREELEAELATMRKA